ncbi:MAG: hypothetical protein K2N90_00910 [Lachnospiraceae bacterium]|nr:hypothetical protein [Lachnospiraceae bacterium]
MNITGIRESVRGNTGAYTYNNYGELTKAVEKYQAGTYTYEYAYDSGENIRTEKVAGPSGTKTHTYTYDSVWKDQLVRYDGKSISYDKMGNPTNYMGAGMTWDVKGNLTSVKNRNGKNAEYTYLSDGQRYTKTTGGKKTTYLYNNGLLLSETTGNEVINYYYDSDGTILGIGCKKGTGAEKHYFFEKNAFGDVIAVYRNSDSILIGTYEYDLWGNPISVKEAATGRDTDGILGKNPFRYRCYYYDTETGFYYLNSRYYDPQIRRFISADDRLAEPGASVIGYNLYTYCDNSPVGVADYDGHCPIALIAGVAITAEQVMTIAAIVVLGYMVYDYWRNPHNEQNPVAVICNTISNQVISIRNAKKNKNGEKVGRNGAGEADGLPNQGTVGDVGNGPLVDAGKQGKHVNGHANYEEGNSTWVPGNNGVHDTQEAWKNGTSLPDGTKIWNSGKVVGTKGETGIRVHVDSKGNIHGYPVNPGRYLPSR